MVGFLLRPPSRLLTANFLISPYLVEAARELCGASFIRTLVSFRRAAAS